MAQTMDLRFERLLGQLRLALGQMLATRAPAPAEFRHFSYESCREDRRNQIFVHHPEFAARLR